MGVRWVPSYSHATTPSPKSHQLPFSLEGSPKLAVAPFVFKPHWTALWGRGDLSVSLGAIVCLLFQDVQVPVCPLCNAPIPVKRGEIPDVVVGEHMDRDCTFHPGRNRNKVRVGFGLA